MEKKNDYLEDLPSILDRVIVWTDNCDTKTSIILSGIGVIIGILLATDYVSKFRSIYAHMIVSKSFWATVYLIFAAVAIGAFFVGIGFLVSSLVPRINPKKYKKRGINSDSLIYFSAIAGNATLKAYKEKVYEWSNSKQKDDYLSEIYVCSVICDKKFRHCKIGILLSLISLFVFLVLAIIGVNVK